MSEEPKVGIDQEQFDRGMRDGEAWARSDKAEPVFRRWLREWADGRHEIVGPITYVNADTGEEMDPPEEHRTQAQATFLTITHEPLPDPSYALGWCSAAAAATKGGPEDREPIPEQEEYARRKNQGANLAKHDPKRNQN